jgi:hypothetical protein
LSVLHSYKLVLLAILVVIPFLIVCVGNRFQSAVQTIVRFVVAVLVVWAYIIGVRLIVVPADLALATTPEQVQAIYDGDGGKNAFAAVFGWIPGVVLAAFSWASGRAWRLIRSSKSREQLKAIECIADWLGVDTIFPRSCMFITGSCVFFGLAWAISCEWPIEESWVYLVLVLLGAFGLALMLIPLFASDQKFDRYLNLMADGGEIPVILFFLVVMFAAIPLTMIVRLVKKILK